MRFIILGRVHPYTRMTQRGKWTSARAKAYLASQESISWQIKDQMIQNDWAMLPAQQPLAIKLSFVIPRSLHRCDLSNLAKAVEDAAQGVAFQNDCWIDRLEARRRCGREWITTIKVDLLNE